MGERVQEKGVSCPIDSHVDREQDPEVIRRRNALFNQYIRPYFNMIYKLVIRYTYNPCYVKENYTEALANLYRGVETYDPKRSIKAWIHICTKRFVFVLDRQREKKSIKTDRYVGINQFDNDNTDVYDDRPSGLAEIIPSYSHVGANQMDVNNYREMYNDDILSVLDELKPIHRDALLLQEAGYSLKEIVEIECKKGTLKSKNIETVKSRLFIARKYLRQHLTRDGERIFDKEDDGDVYDDRRETHQS